MRPSDYQVMVHVALLARDLTAATVRKYLKCLKDYYKQRGRLPYSPTQSSDPVCMLLLMVWIGARKRRGQEVPHYAGNASGVSPNNSEVAGGHYLVGMHAYNALCSAVQQAESSLKWEQLTNSGLNCCAAVMCAHY